MWRKYFIRHSEAIVLCLGLFLLQCTIYLPQTSFDLDRMQMVNNLAFSILENSSVNQYIPFVKKASTDSKVPPELVLAVIVVENHVRPPTRRKIEEIFARSGLALTGKVPDISLGVGQVKISTARQILISKSFTD